MHRSSRYVAGLVLLVVGAFPACSSDPADGPGGEAGSAGQARGGSSPQAGTPSQGGATPRGGTSNGGKGGVGSGGDITVGGAGGEDGERGGEAGANQAGADGGGDVIADCLKAPVVPDTNTQAVRFTGSGVELGIVRHYPIDLGISKALPYTLQRFALVRGDVAVCVSDPQSLDYTPSHHNWDDEATASAGSETWVLKTTSVSGAPSSVEGRIADSLTWGPLELSLASCERLDAPGMPCR